MSYNNFVIPSIDLLNGKIVRLYKGDYDRQTIYNIQIDDLLQKYGNFKNIHIVDLDAAAKRELTNVDLIKEIRDKFNGKIQVGGGIRSIKTANKMIKEIGIDKVVLGTVAIADFKLAKQIVISLKNDHVVLAIDCKLEGRQYIAKTNGWKENSGNDLFSILKEYNGIAKHFLVTDISLDGTMLGPNFELYKQIKEKFPNFVLQASGGVSSIEDIRRLQEITDFAIVGKALYEGLTDDLC